MSKRFPALLSLLLLFIATLAFAAPTPSASEEKITPANPNDPSEGISRDDSGYIPERAIIRDAKTGKLRKPTAEETTDLVATLKKLTNRSMEGLEVTTAPNGMQQMDLDGRFMMTVIARPTEDGGTETICVTSFEQAAEFLGLRPQGSTKPEVKPVAEVR